MKCMYKEAAVVVVVVFEFYVRHVSYISFVKPAFIDSTLKEMYIAAEKYCYKSV